MIKLFRHLHVINKHRRLVRKICFKIGIPLQGCLHDLSKYSFKEFFPSVKNFTNGKSSPTALDRKRNGYSKIWLHHKGLNKHHFEYWIDINPNTKDYAPIKMPLKYLKEMFADRIAAYKVYKGESFKNEDPLIYLESHCDRKWMHEETYDELKRWLNMYIEKGEKETFKIIKNIKRY